MEKDKRHISHVRTHLCTLSTRRSHGCTICLLLFPQTAFVKGINGYKSVLLQHRINIFGVLRIKHLQNADFLCNSSEYLY